MRWRVNNMNKFRLMLKEPKEKKVSLMIEFDSTTFSRAYRESNKICKRENLNQKKEYLVVLIAELPKEK